MFIDTDSFVLLSKESIKTFGATGAVILQTLHDNYSSERIPLDVDTWAKPGGILDFIQADIIKRTITGLINKGLISVVDNQIYIERKKVKVTQPEMFTKGESQKQKTTNPVWLMAVMLQKIYHEDTQLTSPKRHLPFAKKLIEKGLSPDELYNLYGDNGWWYRNVYKGQQGHPPNQNNISTTIHDALSGEKVSNNKNDKATDNFWS